MKLEEEYYKWCENIGKWDKYSMPLVIILYSVNIISGVLFPIYFFWTVIGSIIITICYIAFLQYLIKRELKSIIERVIEEKESDKLC